MEFRLKHVVTVVGVLGYSTGASATILEQRCTDDSLDPAQAIQRNEWARKCGLAYNSGGTGAYFNTELPASNGGYLYEYTETTVGPASRMFSGDFQSNEINSTYLNTIYLSSPITSSIDAQGFYKWTGSSTRVRPLPLYPTFSDNRDITAGTPLRPHATLADCNLYRANGTVAPAFYVNGYCRASCYSPEQEVLFSDGPQAIVEARKAMREDLVTLTADSTLDAIQLQTNQTYSFTEELRDTRHTLYEIATESGGHLRVTGAHPIIQGEGRLVQAQTLKVGDELVKVDGSRDRITDIRQTPYFGKVYNVRPVTDQPVTNILVAQGFLVGSSTFQNDDIGYINRVILFSSTIPAEIIP
ncbi:Hint domain-containing protein [Stigmatella hybrida]|uniref:Hint domain-containing protein n=1 Tax=Stigmatella hybrida TaxID=394097 RepID=UPI001CDA5EAE|nr:Hint domain-containing protein [Stigmatella hybrida]